MTNLRKASVYNSSILRHAFCMLTSIGMAFSLQAQQAYEPAVQTDASAKSHVSGGWQSMETVHLIGLPEVKQKEKGSLSISSTALTFASPGGNGSVQRTEIFNVSIGDVNIESGGTAGKITRAVIPFGGGSALAMVTHKKFSLLTIQFDDQRGALHGAVFLLPKDDALQAQRQLGPPTSQQQIKQPHGPCETNGGVLPDTIKVTAITSLGDPVPAEYRMLIYEKLVRRLREEGNFTAVYRDGDNEPEASCPKYSVILTLNSFKKGDAAVRASTGPVGFFVGATKLKFELQLQNVNGKTFTKELQASQRGDTESLSIADKIAKALTKEVRKGTVNTARS